MQQTLLYLGSIFDDVVKKLDTSYDVYPPEVRSRALCEDSKPLAGYVQALAQGHAIFITKDRRPYLITMDFALYHKLKTGDFLHARVNFEDANANFLVYEAVEVQHVSYDVAPKVKPTHSFDLFGKSIAFGSSIMVPVQDNADIIAKVSRIIGALPADVVPVLLSFDGRPTNFDVPTSFFTKPSFTSREKLMGCLLAFFHAKQQADTGKDVVLIVDSLDKMFYAFNNCMQKAGIIDPSLYSSAAVMDYENILCSSGQLQAGGSLTIIGLHHPGTTPQLRQVHDRLAQIMDAVIEVK